MKKKIERTAEANKRKKKLAEPEKRINYSFEIAKFQPWSYIYQKVVEEGAELTQMICKILNGKTRNKKLPESDYHKFLSEYADLKMRMMIMEETFGGHEKIYIHKQMARRLEEIYKKENK